MKGLVEQVLSRYGSQIVLQRGEEKTCFRGFFHHTASRDWHNMEKVFSPLGQIPRGQYALIAPATLGLKVGDVLEHNGKSYGLRRVETILFRDTALYSWGLCVERGATTEWPQ
jgi:hypothetical protein